MALRGPAPAPGGFVCTCRAQAEGHEGLCLLLRVVISVVTPGWWAASSDRRPAWGTAPVITVPWVMCQKCTRVWPYAFAYQIEAVQPGAVMVPGAGVSDNLAAARSDCVH